MATRFWNKSRGKDTTKESVFIRCDGCGDVLKFEIDPRDKNYIADVASGFGWVRTKGKYLCNSCKEEF